MYFIYVDRSEDTGEVFYVGHGKEKRLLLEKRATKGWLEIASRGFNRKVVGTASCKEDAVNQEERLITSLKELGVKLVNKSLGPGSKGIKQTNPNSIKALLDNHATKGKSGIYNPHTGKKRSEDTRRRISEGVRGTMTEAQRLSMLGVPKPKFISVETGRIRTRQTFLKYYPEELPYLMQI